MSALTSVLSQLDKWRHLPTYKLESRMDVFFGMLMPEFIEANFDVCVYTVIPEFPLHECLYKAEGKAQHKDNEPPLSNRSSNVDFAVFATTGSQKVIFLVELKTDMESLKEEQLERMIKTRRNADGVAGAILESVREIAMNSPVKRKYAHLVWSLLEIDCFDKRTAQELKKRDLETSGTELKSIFRSLEATEDWAKAPIKLVILSPDDPASAVKKEFVCCLSEFTCVTFRSFTEQLRGAQTQFTSEEVTQISDFLNCWARKKAGYVNLC